MNKIRKIRRGLLAVVLVLSILFVNSNIDYLVAEETTLDSQEPLYVSEVQIFSGNTLSEAVKKCEDDGFIAVKKNLNYSAEGDVKYNGIYVIGYKTTTNAAEGITDISLQQMKNGYQEQTYAEIAQIALDKLGNVPNELATAVEEVGNNYRAGSPAAVAAVMALNCYYVDEQNNQKLGDYVVSGNCGSDFVGKLLTRANTGVIAAFCNMLVAGVADYGDGNWGTRISATGVQTLLKDDENYDALDAAYKVRATELVDSLQAFAESYTAAKDRYDASHSSGTNGSNAVGTAVDTTTVPDDVIEAMSEGGEINEEDGDTLYLFAYTVLNQYDYYTDTEGASTKLGDYIVSLGNSTYDEIANLRKIYPLVASLSAGQLAVMRLSGVAVSAIYLENEEAIIEETQNQLEGIKEDIRSSIGQDSMSVWTGTDQTAYDEKVAVTSAAVQANDAGQIYNRITNPDSLDRFLSSALSKLEVVMTVAGIGVGLISLATFVANYFVFTAVYTGALTMWGLCCAGIGCGFFATFFGLLGCTVIVLSYLALIAILVVIVIMLIKSWWDSWHDDDAETFTPIPKVMYDVSNNMYVRYDVITDGSEGVNINGSNARRWNALYYSKSSYVGNPITSSEMDDLIVVQYDDSTTPVSYKAVKNFGQIAAANLNANSKSDSAAVYMFLKTSATVINEGEAASDTGDGQSAQEEQTLYLSALSLSVESSETAAKSALIKSGYEVLDVNLTPVTAEDKSYTYLGYKTTINASSAITDIRIEPHCSSSTYMYGKASYTACGTTPAGDTLYYTAYKSAGTPILADLVVKYAQDDVPGDGYEPVNLFCGGNAYNLNTGSEMDTSFYYTQCGSLPYAHWEEKGTYLYFKPSETYTSGQQYISGLVIVEGFRNSNDLGNTADDYINELGLQKFDVDLSENEGFYIEYPDHYRPLTNICTYIAYTTTYNPYRAIYGIKSYAAAPGNFSVAETLGNSSSGYYSACDVMFELPYEVDAGASYDKKYFYRGVFSSNSYQYATKSGNYTGVKIVSSDNMLMAIAPEDYEDVDWTSCSGRGKGIYVVGPNGGTPLTLDDVVVTSSAEIPEGFVCVQDFKTPNRTGLNNLGYNSTDSKYLASGTTSTPVYIYVRQETPVEKTYISAIYVASYTFDSVVGSSGSDYSDEEKEAVNLTGSDYCIQSLLSKCTDEIIQVNIAENKSDTFYSDPTVVADSVSYIGVSRSNSETDAITGIIKYVTSSTSVSTTITVGNVEYTKAGDMIQDPKGSYYLYYTKASAATPGMPITDITASDEVYDGVYATALSANAVDEGTTKAKLYGDVNQSIFIHMAYVDKTNEISAVYVGHGGSRKAAQLDLLALGCVTCLDMDLNKNAGGDSVYIGYAKYNNTKQVAKYAVRDLIFTVGEAPESSKTINGLTYYRAVDDYSGIPGKGVSLNEGTDGEEIYIYYTLKQTEATSATITKLGVACQDYGMVNDNGDTWEYTYDTNGNRVNLNEGAIGTMDDGEHIVDNRIYLFVNRTDNVCKEGCEVDTSSFNSEFVKYDVYMKGAGK